MADQEGFEQIVLLFEDDGGCVDSEMLFSDFEALAKRNTIPGNTGMNSPTIPARKSMVPRKIMSRRLNIISILVVKNGIWDRTIAEGVQFLCHGVSI